MKTSLCKGRLLFIACMFFLQSAFSQTSGRVVINEYMTWTSNGCGTTAEFIELLNFGPGAVDISCYILTTGKYSITIPPVTILQPGEFYILGGQDFIPGTCANIDSGATGINVDLNWNTCGCTNTTIPKTGDGMMTDGGSANTPLVLMDPNHNVIDAVVRELPAEPSSMITPSTLGGRCGGKPFDLAQMKINYEQLGKSAGRGNSFARTVDGDCVWLKDPAQSGNASNNRSGRTSDIEYIFSMVNSTDCNNQGGKVSVYVEHYDYASVFPMTYTLAVDINNDGVFGIDDEYRTMTDSTPPVIEASGLPVGRYRITLASQKGCYLETFEFTVIECYPVLPVQLEYFRLSGQRNGNVALQWKLHEIENLDRIIVQKAEKSGQFIDQKELQEPVGTRGSKVYTLELPGNADQLFRLKIISKDNKAFYSPLISASATSSVNKVWPSPATNALNVQLVSPASKKVTYTVYNSSGISVDKGMMQLERGQSVYSLAISKLLPGIYQLQVNGLSSNNQPISFRFVKH